MSRVFWNHCSLFASGITRVFELHSTDAIGWLVGWLERCGVSVCMYVCMYIWRRDGSLGKKRVENSDKVRASKG